MKVNIALLTVTDTRTIDNDKSGGILVNKFKEANHNLIERKICKNEHKFEKMKKNWIISGIFPLNDHFTLNFHHLVINNKNYFISLFYTFI